MSIKSTIDTIFPIVFIYFLRKIQFKQTCQTNMMFATHRVHLLFCNNKLRDSCFLNSVTTSWIFIKTDHCVFRFPTALKKNSDLDVILWYAELNFGEILPLDASTTFVKHRLYTKLLDHLF